MISFLGFLIFGVYIWTLPKYLIVISEFIIVQIVVSLYIRYNIMKNTEDYVITNELMDVNTIILDAYGTLLTPSNLKIRKALEDFSVEKQKEIYSLLRRAQDFDDVLEIIPFLSRQKKEQFIANIEKDLANIKPYDETFSILDYLKDKYTIIVDSNLIPPYDVPIKDNF